MRKVYLDHAATTPVDPKVLDAMMPYFVGKFGNPSNLHDVGRDAKNAVEEARAKTGALIGARGDEIYFTSSGAESNNFALKGLAQANSQKGKHIIVSQIEHFSVLHPVKTLEKSGFTVTAIPTDQTGLVDPAEVAQAITGDTILVSIMHANNEIGTIQKIEEIARITKEKNVLFHTDAVASVGWIPVDVKSLGVDALSLSGHQFYGPKGAAALYVRKGIRIKPQIEGGIQEDGRRAGTENVPAIVGLGKAAEIAASELPNRLRYLAPLRDRLQKGLMEKIDHMVINGHPARRLPHNLNVSMWYVEGESMLLFLNMEGISVSSGSACTSRSLKASHVLTCIGTDAAVANGTLLMTLGMGNTPEDIDYVIEKLPPIVQRLREMSPLYEDMIKKEKGK
ncbi:MAG TPA: IscS subfamily cysteine desulfurase [Nitrospirota bacterium]|nr:IscS subfamily cysteine desulfurase [Nitrospirota bacterium]